ncbi:MAG TPA: class I SAM-dependent methyltransferase [Candidatus Dormibacteraeota bacterium]|nr:class I SAM-dependent methyltransferase [Candidatus Dormibacteraeota bacterium]
MLLDLGTGDGRHVVERAAAMPGALVIGVDASPASMAPAWRRLQRRRLTNALLVVARAEALPADLDGLADEVTAHFPWGSLLRGLLTADAAIASGLARVTRPGAEITALVSVTERERALELPGSESIRSETLAAGFRPFSLEVRDWRPATPAEVEASHSSWAKRLGVPARRPAWLLRLARS